MASPLRRLNNRKRSGSPRIVPSSKLFGGRSKPYYGTYGNSRGSHLEEKFFSHTYLADSDIQSNKATFDGVGDAVAITGDPDIHIGSSDFTMETIVTFDSFPQPFPMFMAKGSPPVSLEYRFLYDAPADKLVFIYSTNGSNVNLKTMTNTISLNTGQEYHIAIVRSGTNIRFFVDGVKQGDDVFADFTAHTDTPRVTLGIFDSSLDTTYFDGALAGDMNYIRLSSEALYEGNFTPPSSLSNTRSTMYLNTFEGADGSTPSSNTL